MGYCAAPNCKNKSTDGIRLFRFPRDKKRQHQWVQNCRRDKWQPTHNSKLCERHFEESQFEQNRADGRKLLKWNAVPTLFNEPNPPESVQCKRNPTTERHLAFQRINKAAVDKAGSSAMVEGEEYYNAGGGEWLEKLDTGQLCRICANPNEYLIPIFEGEGLEHELALKIKKHLPIEVSEADTLPRQVCYQCASTLIAWHDLVICCVEANKKLQELQAEENQDDQTAEAFEAESYDSDTAEGAVENKEDVSVGKEIDKTTKPPTKRTPHLAKEKKSKQKPLVESSCLEKSTEFAESVSKEEKASESVKPNEGASQESSERLCGFGEDLPSETEYLIKNQEYIERNKFEDITESICPNWIIREDEQDHCLSDVKETGQAARSIFASYSERSAELVDHDYVQYTEPSMSSASFCVKAVKNQISLKCENLKGICHAKFVVSNQPVSCDYCEKQFGCEAVAVTHRRKHTNFHPFVCKLCGKGFMLRSSLLKHHSICCNLKDNNVGAVMLQSLVKKGENEHYVCTICGKMMKLKPSLKDHLNAHMGNARRKQKCGVCGEKFLTKAEIKDHMLTHADMLLSCEICDKKFVNQRDLSDHTISHNDDRPFICAKCGVSYKRKSHLTRHELCHLKEYKRMPQVLNKPGTKYCCEHCGKIWPSARLLAMHLVSHTGERNFECSVCGKRFGQSGAMTRHVRVVHGGAKDYICDICGQSFTAKATKDNHMRIHTGEKPYQCESCGKTFRTQQQQRVHERIHTDARPYPCPLCTKCFRRRPHLVVHLRTHTGEKPYACNVCGRCFAQKNDVTKHMLIHNRNRYVRV